MKSAAPHFGKILLTSGCLLLAIAGRTETVEESRQRFAKERAPLPVHGLYEDFRAAILAPATALNAAARKKILDTARSAGPRSVALAETYTPESGTNSWTGFRDGVLFLSGSLNSDGELSFPFDQDGPLIRENGLRFKPSDRNETATGILARGVNLTFNPNSPSNFLTHFLAREFTEPLIREALAAGHFYVADDWLCDPTGFMFGAMNNQGVFNTGDEAVTISKTRVMAVTPTPAKLRLFHETQMVQETFGANLIFDAKENGSYRLEAWLTVAGEDRPWIFSTPVKLRAPGFAELARIAPLLQAVSNVTVVKDIPYRAGASANPLKHKLDVYTRPGVTNAPVLFFVHGGAWKTGDRSQYPPLGSRYAREGCVAVLPSYRLAPKFPHPAQIEDVAAAFAWTVRNISQHGGDTNRIFVAGHSAGAHLVSLLALDEKYLAAQKLSPKLIRGVLGFSGVYNLSDAEMMEFVFGSDSERRRAASPLFHIKRDAPPFLLTYCEWNYFSLPAQAKEFHGALRKGGVSSELVFIPRQDHISEMLNVASKDDPTVAAALKFMK